MSRQNTAKEAADILVRKDLGFVVPTNAQRKALLVAFAQENRVLYGKAFDIVRLGSSVDLDRSESIEENLKEIQICEIKSTAKKGIGEDFRGYFFAVTAGELLVAQNLKEQFCFVFVNINTGHHLELSLREILARSRGIYPTWSIML